MVLLIWQQAISGQTAEILNLENRYQENDRNIRNIKDWELHKQCIRSVSDPSLQLMILSGVCDTDIVIVIKYVFSAFHLQLFYSV